MKALFSDKNVHRRHWWGLGIRILDLFLNQSQKSGNLICTSYDHIADGYDDAWTNHMRGLSLAMIDRLDLPVGASCLDLTCGTGFIAGKLAERTSGQVTGVDASAGMLEQARTSCGDRCDFIQADIMDYLRSCPRNSFDVVTCGWGLGYTQPMSVVREIARVLRPKGCVGIIDNTLFSLVEVLWASMLAFAEQPDALQHVMKVRFLPASGVLTFMMRMCGLAVSAVDDGSKTYYVPDGQAAIERLTATGAAAGFEFAADGRHREAIFARFAEILEQRYITERGIAITHRYLMAIGGKR